MRGPPQNRLEHLGFESLDSFSSALRLDRCEINTVADLCRNAYPYDSWREPKKSGNGSRLIETPHAQLKRMQKRINALLQRLVIPPVFHGSIIGTSIKTNAAPHCFDSWFIGLDLADYYQTIRPNKVYESLRGTGACPDVARLITALTTIKHRVPQGAPTSPIIAAIAMMKLAVRMRELVEGFSGRLTVFGDNLSVSAKRDLRRYRGTLIGIVRAEGFRVRVAKSVICRPGEDKPLPGVVIKRQRITVADEDRVEVERIVRRCQTMGIDGLKARVCSRFRSRLKGMLKHYAWIDRNAMEAAADLFDCIMWPAEYSREPCSTLSCHCM